MSAGPEPRVDVAAARRARPFSRRERLGRAAWLLAHPLFAFSPAPLHAWRRLLLRLFGARVGRGVAVYPSARIALPWLLELGEQAAVGPRAILYCLGPIRIGARATVSQGAHLCAATRDHRRTGFPLLRQPIEIGEDAWVAAEAWIGPGVSVGRGAVVAARAVVVRSVEAWQIVGGNPARSLGRRELG